MTRDSTITVHTCEETHIGQPKPNILKQFVTYASFDAQYQQIFLFTLFNLVFYSRLHDGSHGVFGIVNWAKLPGARVLHFSKVLCNPNLPDYKECD